MINTFDDKPGGPEPPTPMESRMYEAKTAGALIVEAPHSEGNANTPSCKLGYDPGSDDDLASKGMLGKKGKGPLTPVTRTGIGRK